MFLSFRNWLIHLTSLANKTFKRRPTKRRPQPTIESLEHRLCPSFTFATLASFPANGTNNASGPIAPYSLVVDPNGNLFGTTNSGGTNGNGEVYEITQGSTSITNLASFSASGSNGANPQTLVMDANGDLFGVTNGGGLSGDGTVFEIPHESNGYGSITTLATFDGPNGASPNYLIMAANGNLFGTTRGDDTDNDGTVFELAPSSTSSTGWAMTTPGTFSTNGSNGINPQALVVDGNGNIFGITLGGASSIHGTVFEIPHASYGSTITTLVSFTGTNGVDPGASPTALIMDANGNLFGTTSGGGSSNDGAVFELPESNGSYGSMVTTLVAFTGTSGVNPGASPAALIMDANGDIFGTASSGGSSSDGTVFEIPKSNGTYASTVTTLVAFTGANNTTNPGASPQALVMDGSGNLFGTTFDGGANSDGTVFALYTPQVTPTITWTNPANITYGTALSSTQLDATATAVVNGATATVAGTFTYTPAAGTVLNAGNNQTLSEHFVPSNSTEFSTPADQTVSINVLQATPTITWTNPTNITYGTALSSTQLDAAATAVVNGATVTVAGTFTYTPAAGTVLLAGNNQTLSEHFVPSNSTNFSTPANQTVSINVLQATPTITWTNPANITYGTALSSTQLDATAAAVVNGATVTVAGIFTYTPAAGTVLLAGNNQTLSEHFVPSDSSDFSTPADQTVSINVLQATPTINWTNPANITYGTALGSTQLNATASAVVNGATVTVAGTFTYTPAAGTVLLAGNNQTLSEHFVPSDSTDFSTPADQTVLINVLQATPTINWTDPANIPYGTPLSSTQLDATATAVVNGATVTVPGTFTYMPAAGTVLNAGIGQTLSEHFVPSDSNDFSTPADQTVSITVGPAVVISAPSILVGANGIVTVALNAGSMTPTGTVSLSVDGGTPQNATLTGGAATFTLPTPSAGDHTLQVAYAAQGGFGATSGSSNLHVLQLEPVTWQHNSSNVTVTGNSLSMATAGRWGSGASSTQKFSSDAVVQFTAPGADLNEALGLTHSSSPNHAYSSLDFSILLTDTGKVTIYESNVYVGVVGTYGAGDSFRITVNGGIVDYYQQKSGSSTWTLLHQSTPSSITYPLSVDTSFNSPGSSFTNVMVSPAVVFTTTSLPATNVGATYSQQISAQGSGAVTYTTGTLPPGLTLSSTGLLSGSPTTAGVYSITVTATDAIGDTASQVLSLVVNAALAITTTALPDATNGSSYSQQINSTGGTSPVTFAETSGSLPTGLGLSTTGLLSGTPTATGSYTFTVTATDSVGVTAAESYTVNTFTPQAATWLTFTPNVTPTGNSLSQNATAGNWASGAASTQSIPAGSNGFVQFTETSTTTTLALGFSTTTTSHSYQNLNYGLVLSGGHVYVYEGGVYQNVIATYGSGDSFRISVDAGLIYYYQQKSGSTTWTLLKVTIPGLITQPLLVNASFYSAGGTISNVLLGE